MVDIPEELYNEEHITSSYIGLQFRVLDCLSTGKDSWAETKEGLISDILRQAPPFWSSYIFLTIEMPCGEMFQLVTPDDLRNLPIKDIPCACGNPNHWFVKFEDLQCP